LREALLVEVRGRLDDMTVAVRADLSAGLNMEMMDLHEKFGHEIDNHIAKMTRAIAISARAETGNENEKIYEKLQRAKEEIKIEMEKATDRVNGLFDDEIVRNAERALSDNRKIRERYQGPFSAPAAKKDDKDEAGPSTGSVKKFNIKREKFE